MALRLILKNGRDPGRVFDLADPESIIGRAKGCAVRIPSADVSRTHCRIVFAKGAVTVEDLGSLNGTQLNGATLTGIAEVQSGDRLQVGPVRFLVEFDAAPAESNAFEVVEETADEALEAVEDDGAFNLEEVPIEPDDEEPTLNEDGDLPGVNIDDDPDWQPAQGGDLRDLLSQIDESDEQPKAGRSKKKKKK